MNVFCGDTALVRQQINLRSCWGMSTCHVAVCHLYWGTERKFQFRKIRILKMIPKVCQYFWYNLILTWRFPKIGVPPKSSIEMGLSIINHPFWVPPCQEPPHLYCQSGSKFQWTVMAVWGRCRSGTATSVAPCWYRQTTVLALRRISRVDIHMIVWVFFGWFVIGLSSFDMFCHSMSTDMSTEKRWQWENFVQRGVTLWLGIGLTGLPEWHGHTYWSCCLRLRFALSAVGSIASGCF